MAVSPVQIKPVLLKGTQGKQRQYPPLTSFVYQSASPFPTLQINSSIPMLVAHCRHVSRKVGQCHHSVKKVIGIFRPEERRNPPRNLITVCKFNSFCLFRFNKCYNKLMCRQGCPSEHCLLSEYRKIRNIHMKNIKLRKKEMS